MASFREILDTDLGPLQKLADQWRTTHKDISGLGKRVQALKKLLFTDLPAIATGDPKHLGEAFTGSYSVNYDVKGQDPDGSLVVEYTLENDTSNESFLHFIGYYAWLEKTNKEEGTFSTVSQTIKWTERIPAGTK
ncbi:hypothetical protein HYE82_21455 [Streptomyces sp. BR123]|uniref:hypothetical protein n=1 Tax=Streptomyces sp. BR123 TaxID=2749828 RepID=UPI0015C4E62A|nr:hypothetical protein [Streptomyces sp. BR123]NXY96902.1 hypothetical protein [Streptomyces sp. BR123]